MGTPSVTDVRPFSRRFALEPGRLHVPSGLRGLITEHVGVARNELVRDAAGHVVDVERRIGLLADAGMEDHLQQQVAQLLDQRIAVTGVDGLDGLVGLLDEVLDQALVGLLGIPRAPTRGTQAIHHGHQFQQPGAPRHCCCCANWLRASPPPATGVDRSSGSDPTDNCWASQVPNLGTHLGLHLVAELLHLDQQTRTDRSGLHR